MTIDKLQSLELDESNYRIILNRLLENPEYTLGNAVNEGWYDSIIMTDKPKLKEFEAEFEVYRQELIDAELARLALESKRLSIRTRLEAMGAYIKDKHRCFSGLSEEMNACGHVGNHALIVWQWIENADDSQLDDLEAKHIEMVAKKEKEKAGKKALKDLIKNKNYTLTKRLNALIEHLGLDV